MHDKCFVLLKKAFFAQVHIGEMQAANGKIPCFCGCGPFNTNL